MIGLYDDNGGRLTLTYDSALTLNAASDAPTSTIEVNEVRSLTNVESIREARPQGDGSFVTTPRKTARIIRLSGAIRATTYGELYDLAEWLAYCTDPGRLAGYADPFRPLDFQVPTVASGTWPTGLIPSRYYALASGTLDALTSYATGRAMLYSIDFYLRDPRRYATTASNVYGTGTATNSGDYRTYPTVTITATGAGSATYSVANTTLSKTVTLSLTGLVNTDVVVVDMNAQTVKKNGVDAASLIVGTPAWFWLDPGASTITVTNGTNMTTATAFRSAWCD